MRPVPNQTPSQDPGAIRLALVGEAPGAVWHRIEGHRYAAMVDEYGCAEGTGTFLLTHLTFPVIRETRTGVWIRFGFDKRFVKRDSKRQFASPTFEQAKEKFIRRKERQRSILQAQLDDVELALRLAPNLQPNETCSEPDALR